jgi:hypothetical protein
MPTIVPPRQRDPWWLRIVLAPLFVRYRFARVLLGLTRLALDAGWAGRPGLRSIARGLIRVLIWVLVPLIKRDG